MENESLKVVKSIVVNVYSIGITTLPSAESVSDKFVLGSLPYFGS